MSIWLCAPHLIEDGAGDGSGVSIRNDFAFPACPLDAKRLVEVARPHRGVENGLQWCCDIASGAADSRVRSRHVPANPTISRRFALNLVKRNGDGEIGIKAGRKRPLRMMPTFSTL